MDPELVALGAQLGDAAVRNTATAVADRITSAKARRKDQETIVELEDIVASLQSDKNELVQIAQAYEQQLVGQRISPEDVDYLTTNVLPILRDLQRLGGSTAGDEPGTASGDDQSAVEIMARLLSLETVNILQLVGFNFRAAIGEPLTNLLARVISSQGPILVQDITRLQELQAERDIEAMRLAQDSASANRYRRLQQ